jgi:drug/metabolite transporter (DMT)-like permease
MLELYNMKLAPWHRYLYRVIAGSVLVVWGTAELLFNPPGDGILPAALLAAGLAFLVIGFIRWKRYGNAPEQDERSRKIGAWGISYSWFVTLLFMTALFWLDHAGMVNLPGGIALGASVILMTISAVIFQMYLARRGDVD